MFLPRPRSRLIRNQSVSEDSFDNLYSPSFMKESISKIRVSQIFLSLINFIEKSNNIYNIKCTLYKNIFYDESNDTNLIS